ncbi:uncharacterized protein [Diabrotica undecimpunctata]|uniref:uncharacterized protein n=1 Tax=Diabrotica undecimpunctata TaxID=50387 RepID=UPI003B633119
MALLGVLYPLGTKKANHTNALELWTSDGKGIEILRAVNMDKKIENQLLKWYEEINSDVEPLDSGKDLSDVRSEHSIHNTDSEQSTQDLRSDPENAMKESDQDDGYSRFYGKDKTPWLKHKKHTPKGVHQGIHSRGIQTGT